MFIIIRIAELIAYNSSVTYRDIYVRMQIAINPYIDTTASNIVTKLCSEGSVQYRTLMLGCHYCQCWQMMGNHNDVLGGTFLHGLLQEL